MVLHVNVSLSEHERIFGMNFNYYFRHFRQHIKYNHLALTWLTTSSEWENFDETKWKRIDLMMTISLKRTHSVFDTHTHTTNSVGAWAVLWWISFTIYHFCSEMEITFTFPFLYFSFRGVAHPPFVYIATNSFFEIINWLNRNGNYHTTTIETATATVERFEFILIFAELIHSDINRHVLSNAKY